MPDNVMPFEPASKITDYYPWIEVREGSFDFRHDSVPEMESLNAYVFPDGPPKALSLFRDSYHLVMGVYPKDGFYYDGGFRSPSEVQYRRTAARFEKAGWSSTVRHDRTLVFWKIVQGVDGLCQFHSLMPEAEVLPVLFMSSTPLLERQLPLVLSGLGIDRPTRFDIFYPQLSTFRLLNEDDGYSLLFNAFNNTYNRAEAVVYTHQRLES